MESLSSFAPLHDRAQDEVLSLKHVGSKSTMKVTEYRNRNNQQRSVPSRSDNDDSTNNIPGNNSDIGTITDNRHSHINNKWQ